MTILALLLVLFFGLAWQGIMVAITPVFVGAVTEGPKEPRTWAGNLQFSDDGFIEEHDIYRIHHEIKVTFTAEYQGGIIT